MLPASLRPYAKAVYPALVTVIAIVGQLIATGEFDHAELATAITGALTALTAFAVRNENQGIVR